VNKISESKTAFIDRKEFITKKTQITYSEFSKIISFYAYMYPSVMRRKEVKEIFLGQEFSEVFCILNTEEQKIFSKVVFDEYCLQHSLYKSVVILLKQDKKTKDQKDF